MKILKWVLIVVLVLIVIGIIALFIFVKNFDVNRYKDKITENLSLALDRPVQLKDIELQFALDTGLTFGIHEFVVSEKGIDQVIFSVESMGLGVSIKDFLASRAIVVTNVIFEKPFVRFIRYPENQTNFDQWSKGDSSSAPSQPRKAPSPSKQEFDLHQMQINAIRINRAQVVFEDRTQETPMEIVLNDINLKVDHLSFDRPFSFALDLNAFGDRTNLILEGKMYIDQKSKSAHLKDTTMKTTLSDFHLSQLKRVITFLEDAGFEKSLKGDLVIDIDAMTISEEGLGDYAFEVKLTDGQAKLKALKYPIENIDMRLVGKTPQVQLKDVLLYLGGGKIAAKVEVDQFLKENLFSSTISVEEIRIEELIEQNEDYTLVGRIFGQAELKGEHSPLKAYDKSLSGSAQFELKEGKIVNLNVLKTALDKLSFIPSLFDDLNKNLPEKYKRKLEQKDTVINECVVRTTIKEDQIFISTLNVEADGFVVSARGKMDFNQNLYLEPHFHIVADLSSALVASSKELSVLLQDDGRIHIPLRAYRGPLEKIKILPDLEELTKAAVRNKGKQELKKAIFKALDIDDAQPKQQPQPSDPSQETAPKEESSPKKVRPEGILIENVLDAIFQ